MMACRPIFVIGNPDNRRVRFFQEALAARGLPPADVLAYRDILSEKRSVEEISHGSVVRIDSPGEDFEVEKQLLRLGEAPADVEGFPVIAARDLADLSFDRGRILFPRQWYLGFRSALRRWHEVLSNHAETWLASWPSDIEVMFDKVRCHRLCRDGGVPVPESLGDVTCFDELIARMEATRTSRVFLKPAHGSSASGAVALRYRQGRITAFTPTEVVTEGGRVTLYNSLKIRCYNQLDEVRVLIDWLAAHRVQVEKWLPKATLDRRVCDLRVVLINGAPRHQVVRTSRSPFTNLHLGNRRGSTSALMDALGASGRDVLHHTCARVAQLFPKSLQMGVDVLFTPGFRNIAVLEINAFGDLLPGALCEGKNTYESQVDAILASARQTGESAATVNPPAMS